MRRLLSLLGTGSSRSPRGKCTRCAAKNRVLRCEPLEDRRLLSVTPYVVDSLADIVADDGMVTFREALQAANENRAVFDAHPGSSSEPDVITFAPALFAEGPGSIVMEGGGFSIEDAVEIQGPGAGVLKLETRSLSLGFEVHEGVEASISGLTVAGEGKGDYRECGVENLGTLTLSGVTIVGHCAVGNYPEGGGIHNEGTLTVENCAIVGNVAWQRGGGIFSSGPMTIRNSTIVANSSLQQGGGIYAEVPFTIVNSILYDNLADVSDGTYADWVGDELYGATTAESGRNLIGVDPCFVSAPDDGGDGWGDLYGTPDIDESANDNYGDLRLQPDSPAIDVGHDESASALTMDLDGNPRKNGLHVDIGAFEYQGASGTTLEAPSTTVTTLEDIVDSDDGVISLREAILYAGPGESTEPAAEIVFDASFEGGTLLLDGEPVHLDTSVDINANALGSLTIDGDGRSRVFEVYSTSRIEGMTVTGGASKCAAAVLNFGDLTLEDMVLRENNGELAGAVFNVRGTLAIEDSVVARNAGGGIHNHQGTLEISTSVISENTGSRGAGVYSLNGSANMVSCYFLGNTARDRGGAIYSGGGSSTIFNSVVVGNTAAREAGGLRGVDVVNSTIVANTALESGGGIASSGMLRNSIVYLNDAPADPDVTYPLNVDNGYNLIGIDPLFVRNPDDGGDGWADDPETPDIDERANNDYGDLRLAEFSPGIDLGDDAALSPSILVDVGGKPRLQGARIDIGAYEFQEAIPAARETPSSIVTTLEDRIDLTDGVVSLREAILYAGFDSTGSDISFDDGLLGREVLLCGDPLLVEKSVTIKAPADAPITVNAGRLSGVFHFSAQDVLLENLRITGGYAKSGGGIYAHYRSGLTLRNCIVTRNEAEESGGGIFYNSGTHLGGHLTLEDCEVSDNTAYKGGGIDRRGGITTVSNSRVFANRAHDGGGMYGAFGQLNLLTTAVVANSAYDGGGIFFCSPRIHLKNATVTANYASRGGGLFLCDPATFDNSIISLNRSDIRQTDPNDELTIHNTLVGTDPHFLRLPDDGGDGFGDDPSTPDVDESANDDYGDLRLAEDSPAIDAGDNSYLPSDITLDLAGNPRIVGVRVDLGAYEYSPPGDLTGDGVVDSDDLDVVRAHWGETVPAARLALGDPSGDGRVGSDDLDLVRANWSPTPSAGVTDSREARANVVDAAFSDFAQSRAASCDLLATQKVVDAAFSDFARSRAAAYDFLAAQMERLRVRRNKTGWERPPVDLVLAEIP